MGSLESSGAACSCCFGSHRASHTVVWAMNLRVSLSMLLFTFRNRKGPHFQPKNDQLRATAIASEHSRTSHVRTARSTRQRDARSGPTLNSRVGVRVDADCAAHFRFERACNANTRSACRDSQGSQFAPAARGCPITTSLLPSPGPSTTRISESTARSAQAKANRQYQQR